MTTTTATTVDVYVIDGRFVCAECVPAEVRACLDAQLADRHTMRGTLDPSTACSCARRVHYSSEHGAHVLAD